MIGRYDWAGGTEAMIRFGPGNGPVVIAALPLFEEANRTRAFTVAILRALAGRGLAGALPDLPGTGESLVATRDITAAALRDAYAAAVAACAPHDRGYALAIRSGALLDTQAPLAGRWHLAPQTGEQLAREVSRIRQAAAREAGTRADPAEEAGDDIIEIAGNLVRHRLLTDLAAPSPAEEIRPIRIVRLASDPAEADLKIAGAPLWRRSEPDNDIALAQTLAADIEAWVARCER